MNLLKRTAYAVLILSSGLGSIGCLNADRPSFQDRFAAKVDPCYPERYNYEARQSVLAPFAMHVKNGDVINQTVFNYFFEPGSAKLTDLGYEKLDYLTRIRPTPPTELYLQTARDIRFDVADPNKLVTMTRELNAKRIESVKQYVAATTAGRAVNMELTVIDPENLSMSVQGPANAVRGLPLRYLSGVTGVVGQGLQGVGGGTLVIPGGALGGVGGVGDFGVGNAAVPNVGNPGVIR